MMMKIAPVEIASNECSNVTSVVDDEVFSLENSPDDSKFRSDSKCNTQKICMWDCIQLKFKEVP